jgi:hypothetical protein
MSEVSDESLRLDGNAAAGLLAEIFPFEMTSAQSECAGCGQTRPLGALMLYGGEMGMVLRCPSCDGVQMRIVSARGRYMIDMRGMSLLQIEAGPQT